MKGFRYTTAKDAGRLAAETRLAGAAHVALLKRQVRTFVFSVWLVHWVGAGVCMKHYISSEISSYAACTQFVDSILEHRPWSHQVVQLQKPL